MYDYAHIGNFRAFLTYDVLKRWLEYAGYTVDHVCNLTDVDDKIIVKMAAENKSLKEITELYTNAFFEDLDVLNIQRAGKYPKATEHIVEIEEMIGKLVDTGYAYVESGSVYFRVKAFEEYGKLARLKMQDMQDGTGGLGPNDRRGSDDKESSRDFVLWKSFNPLDKEVVWESAFGRGRPGWHIECSAMCNKHLGETIDIHAGGIDLVFPHHENEIAQTEAYTGKQFCNYWIHNGFVNINDEKMSKSLKNFKTLRDIAQSPFDARAFRFMVVTAQYRSALNFNPDTLKSASNSLKRIDKLLANLAKVSSSKCLLESQPYSAEDLKNVPGELMSSIQAAQALFEEAMCDDLNTPRAAAALFMLVALGEKSLKSETEKLSASQAACIELAIMKMDRVLGVFYEVPRAYFAPTGDGQTLQSSSGASVREPLTADQIPLNVAALAQKRSDLKAQKLFADADIVRAEVVALGYEIKDRKNEFDIYKL